MSIALRDGTPADAEVCCQIIFEAFKNIAERRNFPPDFQSPEMLLPFVTRRLSIPSQLVIVAEQNSQVLGSCFGDTRSPVAGVGPITVTPSAQGGVGSHVDGGRAGKTRPPRRCQHPTGAGFLQFRFILFIHESRIPGSRILGRHPRPASASPDSRLRSAPCRHGRHRRL